MCLISLSEKGVSQYAESWQWVVMFFHSDCQCVCVCAGVTMYIMHRVYIRMADNSHGVLVLIILMVGLPSTKIPSMRINVSTTVYILELMEAVKARGVTRNIISVTDCSQTTVLSSIWQLQWFPSPCYWSECICRNGLVTKESSEIHEIVPFEMCTHYNINFGTARSA